MLTQRHHVCEPASRSECQRVSLKTAQKPRLTQEMRVDRNEDGAAVRQEDGGDAHVL